MEADMETNLSSKLLAYHQETFDELYIIDTIVQMTKKSCQDYEFSGQYYGIPMDMTAKLSAERNHYINMLNILSERISNIMSLNLSMENEIMLEQNANNCRREITTKGAAY